MTYAAFNALIIITRGVHGYKVLHYDLQQQQQLRRCVIDAFYIGS